MGRLLSQDLRSRVIAAVDDGLSRRAAAERLGIEIATAIRWVRDWRLRGRAIAMPMGGDVRSQRIEVFAPVILAAIGTKPDITLFELAFSRSSSDHVQKRPRTPASSSGRT